MVCTFDLKLISIQVTNYLFECTECAQNTQRGREKETERDSQRDSIDKSSDRSRCHSKTFYRIHRKIMNSKSISYLFPILEKMHFYCQFLKQFAQRLQTNNIIRFHLANINIGSNIKAILCRQNILSYFSILYFNKLFHCFRYFDSKVIEINLTRLLNECNRSFLT